MSTNGYNSRDEATFTVKSGLAEMLKGGVIMDVVPEEAKIAEDAGGVCRDGAGACSRRHSP